MSEFRQYDYIIAGAGCAGLSLLVHLIHSGHFSSKKILLIDKVLKDQNDRTWCFWENKSGLFETIVQHSWSQIKVRSDGFDKTMDIKPYKYKLIRGIDFYNYSLELVKQQPNVEIRYASVESIGCDNEGSYVITNGQRINASYVFNSILFQVPVMKRGEYHLLQHFRGWFIEMDEDVFDEDTATLMDFTVSQKEGTSFVYVMPFSNRTALVEFTMFSKAALTTGEYESELANYLSVNYPNVNYFIGERESGVIPMTNHKFDINDDKIINIGTAGGQTKGSTGYTFQFIQKHSAAIIAKLKKEESPVIKRSLASRRFDFYDTVLLSLLHDNKISGSEIFTTLFKKNKAQEIFRFLDNDSSMMEELRITGSLPKAPFIKAALKHI